VRALSGTDVLAESVVEHVGIGEVFVVAGQSNSANHGEGKQKIRTGLVADLDGQRWRPANDPQPGASGGGGGSFIPPFGDALAEKFRVPVGSVACGVGATSVRAWLPKGAKFPNPPTLTGHVQQLPDGGWASKGSIFSTFSARMKHLGPRGFRAVLWHQGESDANQADPTRTLPGNLYRDYLEQLNRTSRREIGWNAPWFVAQASYHVPGDEATLNGTDVVIWWSHQKNHVVTDENVERLVTRVRQGRLGFIALHSAHWARPFVRLMQERAKDDALAQIPAAERATATFEYFNQNSLGKVPRRDAPLTPALRQEDGVWKLTLPGCIFPAYRGDGAPSRVTTLLPDHPIAAGLPLKWDVKQTEMYDEPFHVPKPDAVVFEERWDKGGHFRSGCVWQVGKGPVFKQAEPLRVVENAARWLAPEN